MNTDKYTVKGSRLESVILSLARSGNMDPMDAIAILAVIAAIANGRPVDGERWIEECQAMLRLRLSAVDIEEIDHGTDAMARR